MELGGVVFLRACRPGGPAINRLKVLDRSEEVMPRSVQRQAAPPLSRSRNQATAIMADHSGLDNNAGLDRSIEAHGPEILAASAAMGLGENAAHRSYFAVDTMGPAGLSVAAHSPA